MRSSGKPLAPWKATPWPSPACAPDSVLIGRSQVRTAVLHMRREKVPRGGSIAVRATLSLVQHRRSAMMKIKIEIPQIRCRKVTFPRTDADEIYLAYAVAVAASDGHTVDKGKFAIAGGRVSSV